MKMRRVNPISISASEEEVVEGRASLPCAHHESVLQWLVGQEMLTDREAWVIVQEYLRDENSVVRKAFCVFDSQRDIYEFAAVIKQMAAMFNNLV